MGIFYEKGIKYNWRNPSGVPYYRATATINGKRKTFYGKGEKDAKRQIEEAKQQTASGLDIDKKRDSLDKVFNYWLYNVKRVDGNIKASTFSKYDMFYRNHVKDSMISNSVLSKLSSATIQAYVSDMYEKKGASGNTIRETIKMLRMFMTWAVDEGYLLKNPCRNISIPERTKVTKELEIFTREERAKLTSYMAETHYQYDTLIRLAFATGMRKGELCGLMWRDLDNDTIHVKRSTAIVTHVDKDGNREFYREIWDTKTANAVRDIPLLPETKAMLEEHRAKQLEYFRARNLGAPLYVFTSNTGTLVDGAVLSRSFVQLLKRAGLPHRRFHAIRHTFATEAIRRGVDVKDLQMLMGHADIHTTYIYVQSDEDSKREAINRMGSVI